MKKTICVLVVIIILMFCHIVITTIKTGWVLGVNYDNVEILEKDSNGTKLYITTKDSKRCYEEGTEHKNIKEENKLRFDSLHECNKFLEIIQ